MANDFRLELRLIFRRTRLHRGLGQPEPTPESHPFGISRPSVAYTYQRAKLRKLCRMAAHNKCMSQARCISQPAMLPIMGSDEVDTSLLLTTTGPETGAHPVDRLAPSSARLSGVLPGWLGLVDGRHITC